MFLVSSPSWAKTSWILVGFYDFQDGGKHFQTELEGFSFEQLSDCLDFLSTFSPNETVIHYNRRIVKMREDSSGNKRYVGCVKIDTDMLQ